MADYICKHCKFNNNGWCVAKKRNKLSEILECDTFKSGKYGDFKAVTQEVESNVNKEIIKQYQISRAKDYLKDKLPKDGSEPSLTWCIISDLLRIIDGK